jgi:DNA polymerase-3 subunit delta'
MIPTPRTNTGLLGHEETERLLRDALASGRLPHGLILAGEAGIGKATLAYRFARYLLSPQARQADSLAISPEASTARRIAASSHGDLIVVERNTDPTTGKIAKEVAVEDVRKIAPFLRMTASENGWRVAIVDDASALNRAGQNALLKILEEPPPRTVLMLVSDRPGMLLPTIHSRCRLIRMNPLNEAAMTTLLKENAPTLDDKQRHAIIGLAEGSIGRALRLVENEGLPLYQEMVDLLGTLPDPNWQTIHSFADRLSGPAADSSYRLFVEFLPGWIARLVKSSAGERPHDVLAAEPQIRERLAGMASLDRWIDACEAITQRMASTDAANLDRRLAVWSAFETLSKLKAA